MEEPSAKRPRAGETYVERFCGLLPEDAAALIQLEMRLHQLLILGDAANQRLAKREISEFLRAHPRRIALHKLVLIYAEQMEAQTFLLHAHRWLLLYAKIAKDEAPLRAFFLRHLWLDDAMERYGSRLSPEDVLTMSEGQIRLAQDPSAGPEHLNSAIRGFASLQHTEGLRRCMKIAILRGWISEAEDAAEKLGYQLVHHDRSELGEGLLKRFPEPHEEILAFIQRFRLAALHRPFIAAAVSNDVPFSKIKEWAGDLGITVSARQKEALYEKAAARKPAPDHEAMVELAEDLAERFPRWKRRLPKLYAKARDAMLENGDFARAERYGEACEKPLTIRELLVLYDRYLADGDAETAQTVLERVSGLVCEEAAALSKPKPTPRPKKTAAGPTS